MIPADAPSTAVGDDTRRRWVTFVFAALIVQTHVYGASLLLIPQSDGTALWNTVNHVGIEFAAAVVVFIRAALIAQQRRAWAIMACALLSLSVGDAIESFLAAPEGSPLNAQASQIFFVVFVVSVLTSLGMLIRQRLARASISVWLDGVIAALGLLAAVSYFTFSSAELIVGGASIAVLYRSSPLLFVAVLVGVLTALDRKPGARWWLMLS
jgi:hypothetical protein